MAPNIKLIYYNSRGFGEVIRVLLKYGNIDFEDERIEYAEWPKIKPEMPFGQLPVYEEDGKRMAQSNAIARHIAKKVNLHGKSDWEDLEIDAIIGAIEDFKIKLMAVRYESDPDKRTKLKETVANETLPYYLGKFDDIAKQNNGHLAVNRIGQAHISCYFTDIPSKITLHYFDARWTTETVRLLLKYGGIEFEDHRIEKSVWGDIKPTMPFGHLPVIEADGKKAAQSIAIARYVAKKVKLIGANDWEDLEIDAIVDTLNDIKEKLSEIFGEEDEKSKDVLKETHLKETLPYYFEKLDSMAKSNNGYLVGKKLTWADFYFTVACDLYAGIVGSDIVERYPNLVKCAELPNGFSSLIVPSGLSSDRKWYLSDNIRALCSDSQKRDFVVPKPNESKLNKKSSGATASKVHFSQKRKKKSKMTAQKKKKIEVKAPQKEKAEIAKRMKVEALDHTIPKK
ncbi:glutathione s-transferase [Holotrichia oblita]|uniref:Glutathione s-transferase n=1 Tax=Holotrichia oblita TaxID=644536 RepID=A0ACB9TVG9_HOLOL|nr:glutathione s-transferase [Holotrichia oblita]